jgi:hypothetical protein
MGFHSHTKMIRPILCPANFHAHIGGCIAFRLGLGETFGRKGSRYIEHIGKHAADEPDYGCWAETAISRSDNVRLVITHKEYAPASRLHRGGWDHESGCPKP